MSAPTPPLPPRRPVLTTGLLGGVLAILGLLSGLPYLLGVVVALVGTVVSFQLRSVASARRPGLEVLPALVALVVLALAAPVARAAELFAGLSALAALLWIADDPRSRPGAWTGAVPTLGLAALGFGLAWALVLAVPTSTEQVGLAGVLLVAALLLVAVVLFVVVLRRRPETA